MNKIELKTADGSIIKPIGLGTYPLQGKEIASIIKSAVAIGYQLFDTADDYRGETGIGMALYELKKEGSYKRESIFLQTKISANFSYGDDPLAGIFFNSHSGFMKRHSVDEIVREKVNTSLREMNTDYLDSLLIHLPYSGFYEEIWDSMINIQKEGKVRYIGVSNFHKKHIEQISKSGHIPSINEIYISPLGSKQEQVLYNNRAGVVLMTYSPLMDLARNLIPLSVIEPIMLKYNKSAAQIVLRWNIERGCIPLPKTRNLKRLEENFSVFDFSLTPDEVETITALNCGYQYLVESKICPGI